MTYKLKDLKEMELEELVELAMEEFGLVPPDDVSKSDLVDQIWREIKAEKSRDEDDAQAKQEDKVEIMIGSVVGPGGKDPVFFGHNGRQFRAHREKWVKIPRVALNSLMNAVETAFERQKTGEVQSRNVSRYNVQVREIAD